MSIKDFAVDRISRIYPLHIITFFIVAALQSASVNLSGYYLAFIYNDTYHAFLNAFLLQAWGFEKGFSYNAPSWSISIETLLYLMFFALLKVRAPKYFLASSVMVLGACLYPYSYNISVGLFGFFAGGILAMSYEYLSNKMTSILMLFISVMTLFIGSSVLIYRTEFNALWVSALLFVPVIFTFTSVSAISPQFLKKLKFFGDISFSIYLIHFPMMIATSIAVNTFDINKSIYLNEYFFLGFIVILTLLGKLSHYSFEIPVMKRIRLKFSSKVKS